MLPQSQAQVPVKYVSVQLGGGGCYHSTLWYMQQAVTTVVLSPSHEFTEFQVWANYIIIGPAIKTK